MEEAVDTRARLEGFGLNYDEKQALDAGDPVPALRGARRRAGWKVALYVSLCVATVANGALKISSGDTPTLSFFIAPWFALKIYESVGQRRRLTELLDGEGAR